MGLVECLTLGNHSMNISSSLCCLGIQESIGNFIKWPSRKGPSKCKKHFFCTYVLKPCFNWVEWLMLRTYTHLRWFSLVLQLLRDLVPSCVSLHLCLSEGDRTPSCLLNAVSSLPLCCLRWISWKFISTSLLLGWFSCWSALLTNATHNHLASLWFLIPLANFMSPLKTAAGSLFFSLWLLTVYKSTDDEQFGKGKCHIFYLLCSPEAPSKVLKTKHLAQVQILGPQSTLLWSKPFTISNSDLGMFWEINDLKHAHSCNWNTDVKHNTSSLLISSLMSLEYLQQVLPWVEKLIVSVQFFQS